MATLEPQPPHAPQPEFNLLMPTGTEQGLWSSLRRNFKETFFPEKLPPLVLTSKPVPVRDIWGFYGHKTTSATLSSIAHIVGRAAILAISAYFAKKIVPVDKSPVTEIVFPSEVPVMKPAPKPVAGGGGGGD